MKSPSPSTSFLIPRTYRVRDNNPMVIHDIRLQLSAGEAREWLVMYTNYKQKRDGSPVGRARSEDF